MVVKTRLEMNKRIILGFIDYVADTTFINTSNKWFKKMMRKMLHNYIQDIR